MAAGWTRIFDGQRAVASTSSLGQRLRGPLRSLARGLTRSIEAGRQVVASSWKAAETAWQRLREAQGPPQGRDQGASQGLPQGLPNDALGDSTAVVAKVAGVRRKAASLVGAAVVEEETVQETADLEGSSEAKSVAMSPQLESSAAPAILGSGFPGIDTEDDLDLTPDAMEVPADGAPDLAVDAPAASDTEVSAGASDTEVSAASDEAEVQESLEDQPEEALEARDSEPEESDGGEPAGDDGQGEGGESEGPDGGPDDPVAEADEAAVDAALEAEADDSESDQQTPSGRDRLDCLLESLLLAAGDPLPVRRMVDVLGGPKSKEVRAALERLMTEYSGPERGIHLIEVSGGFQFRTAPDSAKVVQTLLREKPGRLGRAALETLSIVAYKQPVTRGDVEAIRGVDADSAINTLLSKRLIKIDGRKETVGRPLLYSTTPEFLEIFGLKDLKELPTLKEIGPVPEPENEADGEEDGIETAEVEEALDAIGREQAEEAADGAAEADGETTQVAADLRGDGVEEAVIGEPGDDAVEEAVIGELGDDAVEEAAIGELGDNASEAAIDDEVGDGAAAEAIRDGIEDDGTEAADDGDFEDDNKDDVES